MCNVTLIGTRVLKMNSADFQLDTKVLYLKFYSQNLVVNGAHFCFPVLIDKCMVVLVAI